MLERLKENVDVIYKKTKGNCEIYYQEHLCNILEFMKDFYPRLEEKSNEDISDLFPGICKKIDTDESLILQLVFSGIMVLFRNKQYGTE